MNKTLKIVFIVAGLALVVCCGGGAAGLYFVLDGTTKAPKAATSDFLDALEGGRSQDAYQALCRSAQTDYGPEEFDGVVKQHPPASHDMSWGGSYSNDGGIETAVISATITYKDGSKSGHSFPLRKEGGVWKVCGTPY